MFCKNQQIFFRNARPPQDRTKKNIKHKNRINVQLKEQLNQKLT